MSYMHLSSFISHVQEHSVEKTYKPSIFAVPEKRESVTSAELRKKRPPKSSLRKV